MGSLYIHNIYFNFNFLRNGRCKEYNFLSRNLVIFFFFFLKMFESFPASISYKYIKICISHTNFYFSVTCLTNKCVLCPVPCSFLTFQLFSLIFFLYKYFFFLWPRCFLIFSLHSFPPYPFGTLLLTHTKKTKYKISLNCSYIFIHEYI